MKLIHIWQSINITTSKYYKCHLYIVASQVVRTLTYNSWTVYLSQYKTERYYNLIVKKGVLTTLQVSFHSSIVKETHLLVSSDNISTIMTTTQGKEGREVSWSKRAHLRLTD